MSHLRTILTTATVLAASTFAHGALTYSFNTGVDGFQFSAWSASGPAGSPGGPALQPTNAAGGWTLGDGGGPKKEFPWDTGEQPALQTLAAAGANARIALDIMVDGTSFPAGGANWYQIHLAGNSDGSAGWTQFQALDAWHNADDSTLYTTHIDIPFSQLGWQAGDGWFQFYVGANSAGTFPVKYYLDNVSMYTVPEPFTGLLCLIGLGFLSRRGQRA